MGDNQNQGGISKLEISTAGNKGGVMLTGYTKNEFGTLVSAHVCDTCGGEFTVCPPAKTKEGWENCLAVNCPSYDKSRDMDLLFDDPERQKEIKRRPIKKCSIKKGPKWLQ